MRRPGTVLLVAAVLLVASPAAAVPTSEGSPAPSPVPDRKPRDPGSIREVEPRGLRPVPIPLVQPRGPKPVPMPLVEPGERGSRLVPGIDPRPLGHPPR